MKKILFILTILLIFINCSNKDNLINPIDRIPIVMITYSGMWQCTLSELPPKTTIFRGSGVYSNTFYPRNNLQAVIVQKLDGFTNTLTAKVVYKIESDDESLYINMGEASSTGAFGAVHILTGE